MKLFRKKELPEVEPVKIKPLFGLKPGLWLTIAYAIAFVLLLFFIGFLPDIINGSKRVTFTSAANTAAVYLDGQYIGGTTFTRRVPSGTHEVSYQVNGCEIDSFTIKVGHPVFFAWLFPRHQSVSSDATLTEDAFKALSAELLEDANAYSAILEYDSVHRYPGLFTEYANSIRTSAYASDLDAFKAALLFVSTDEMYQDAKDAMEILGVDLPIAYESLNKDSTIGVANAERPVTSAKGTSLDTGLFKIEGYTISKAQFSNGRTVQATFPEVMEAGRGVETQSFSIGAYCVTENQFAQFIQANPDWGLSNKDNLIAQGLVDEYYLDGVTLSVSIVTNKPVRNVSWYAAQAYCQWLSGVTGKTVYLPTEDQWMAASFSDAEGGYQKSLVPSTASGCPSAMIGGVWEMTGTCFLPLSRIADQSALDAALETIGEFGANADMVIKGGSYISDFSVIDSYSVGTTYRSLCSDYMGFRIAWN